MKRVHIVILTLTSLLGCYQEQPENTPEVTEVFFPGSVLSIDNGTRVLVANTAFDRSYDRGHISVLSAEGELDTESSILTGIFGGQLSVSDTLDDDHQIVVLPTREDDLIEVFKINAERDQPLTLVDTLNSFGRLPMATGPMSSVWTNGYFLIGHGSGRTVSAWSLDPLTHELSYGCSIGLATGVHFMSIHPQTDEVYVTSRFSGSVAVLTLEDAGWIGDPSTRTCRLSVDRFFDSHAANTHALQFSADGSRLYLSSLIDGTVTLIDVAPNTQGVVEETIMRRRWVGSDAGVVKLSPVDGLLYVANADTKRLIQLDPLQLSIRSELSLSGRPFDYDFVETEAGVHRVMMSFFADHEIGVVEIDGSSLTEIAKIGAAE
jgi:WD40 repeat protein